MMGRLNYDAIALGEQELNYGLETFIADVKAHKLPITCANLVPKGDTKPLSKNAEKHGTVFDPYLVVERDGVEFGFIGVLSPNTKLRGMSRGAANAGVEALTYRIDDPLERTQKALRELRDKCDIVIMLAHMDQIELEQMLPNLPPVDLVVLGHDARTGGLPRAMEISGATVVKATSQGQYLGHLQFSLDENMKLTDGDNQVFLLDNKYPDDAETMDLVEQFEAENREVQKKLFAQEQLKAAEGGGKPDHTYLGVAACQKCHVDEFEAYKESGHARAYATLAEQFMHRDTNCVGCHVTGYKEKGGFMGARVRGSEVDLIDVQCEACHGPGSEHVRDGSYAARAKDSCVTCHTKDQDPDFDFKRDWLKIAH